MLVSSLRTNTYTYTPVTPTAVDTKKVLFKTTLPNSNSSIDGDAFVYSTKQLRDGKAAPSNAVILQNQDGSYFSIDLSANANSKVNMIATNGNLNLYVYNAETQSADKFTFDATGLMSSATNLDARDLSAAEIANKRDLDGNGAIGAKLDKTRGTGGVLDAVGGVFKVKVKDEDLFVVGAGLDRATNINASTSALLNADGTAAWKPDETYVGYSAVNNGATWDVYGRTAAGSVTKFSFDANKKLTGTQVMSYTDMVAAESTKKRDLNGDGKFGVGNIVAKDAKGGLYQGTAFGQDIYLAKTTATTTAKTSALAVDLSGSLLSTDGTAWSKPTDYVISAMVNTGTSALPAYSVYTYKSPSGGTANKNDILRFDFAADGASGNFKLTAGTVAGVAMTAADMAKAEKDAKRDLNTDGTFGATITSPTDILGATIASTPASPIKTLFKATMIGTTTYVVGNKLSTGVTGDLAKDFTSSLLARDGSAWSVKTDYKVASLVETAANTYDVYAYKSPASGTPDKTDVIKYSFAVDGTNFKVTEPTAAGIAVNASALAAAEKLSKADLNSDGFYGVTIDAALDTTGGLYKATAMSQQYLLVGTNLSSSANAPTDLTNALLGKDGKAWKPENVASVTGTNNVLRLVTENVGYSVYVKDDNGQFSKYSFDASKTLTSGPLAQTALDMATAEAATPGRDLNKDGNFGVVFDSTFSAQGDIYKASMLGRTAYIVTTPAPATGAVGSAAKDFSGSLQTADGSAWAVKDGYRVTGAVKTSANSATPVKYDVYAIKSTTTGGVTTDDTTDVIKYSFTGASGNFTIDPDTAAGVKVTAKDLAAVEKSKASNLNADAVFGVSIEKTLDNTGGLYVASALGNKFVILGTPNLTSTSSNPQDLAKALLNADGTAWNPDGAATGNMDVMLSTNSLKVVTESGGDYSVYVKNATTTPSTPAYAKYAFGTDYVMTGNRIDMTAEQMAALEKTLSRDLTGDSKYGVNITDALDSVGGLYKGGLGAQTNVYFAADPNLTLGSEVASKAIDFNNALLNVGGDYWSPGSDYTIKKAFTSGTGAGATFNVIASITGDDSHVRQFTFSNVTGADKTLQPDATKDLTLIEFAALETTKARDLNGDSIIGVRVNQTAVDRIGGLFEANIGAKKYLTVAATASAVNTNLSTALLNKDGTAWTNGTATNTVIYDLGSGAGYDVYTKDASTYTQYHFDASYTLDSTKTKVLNTVELAAAEKTIQRDINGDNVLGARITQKIDTTTGNYLSTASFNNTTYVLATATDPGNSADLSSALLAADGTAWKLDVTTTSPVHTGTENDYTLQRVKINSAGSSYEVFATKSDGTARRFTFGADRTLQKTTNLSKDQLQAELTTVVNGSYEDSVGGLYKASVLGNTFYVKGTTGGASAPADLSNTLFTTNGAAWAPRADYKIGGMVKTVVSGTTSYDVYTYTKDNTTGVVTNVKKDSWDSALNYLGETTADPAALVDLETTAASASLVGYGRDLNGDGAVGFKTTNITTTPVSNYKGVTSAMVGGASNTTVFLIAGKDMTSGNTLANGLSLKDALLNSTGTGAWAVPDSGYNITAVDDTGASRFVYAVKTGTPNLVNKYEFSKTTGKSLGAGIAVSAIDLAAVEKTENKDLNADNFVGAVSVSKVTDLDAPTRDIGLLKASMNGTEFYVFDTMPVEGAKIDLSKALLNQDGTNWTQPTGFTVKGTYQASATDPIEVYGLNATGEIQQFKFSQTVDPYGTLSTTYTVMDARIGAGTVNNLTGANLAKIETDSAVNKDLNGDGAIGYKVANATPIAVQTAATAADSYGVGTATVSNGSGTSADQIYIVGADYSKIGTAAGTSTANAALTLSGGGYWKPDAGYTVKSIVVDSSALTLDVFAQDNSGANPTYLKYSFTTSAIGGAAWEQSAVSSSLTSADLLALEVDSANSGANPRDLNGDRAVGLKVDAVSTGVYTAHIDNDNYYLVGTDLATGTTDTPLGLDSVLYASDGTMAWAPTSGASVSGWRAATATEIAANQGATHVLTETSGSTDTLIYFDADTTPTAIKALV